MLGVLRESHRPAATATATQARSGRHGIPDPHATRLHPSAPPSLSAGPPSARKGQNPGWQTHTTPDMLLITRIHGTRQTHTRTHTCILTTVHPHLHMHTLSATPGKSSEVSLSHLSSLPPSTTSLAPKVKHAYRSVRPHRATCISGSQDAPGVGRRADGRNAQGLVSTEKKKAFCGRASNTVCGRWEK